MITDNKLHYRNYIIAAIITSVIAVVLLVLSYTIGKDDLFLLLNEDLGPAGDFFFNYATHLGDGLLWIVWLIAILTTKRKHLLPLLIASFILVTGLTQLGKQVIYPDELRPSEALKLGALGLIAEDDVKTINGVPVETNQDVFNQLNKMKVGDNIKVTYYRGDKLDSTEVKLKKDYQLHLLKNFTLHTYSSFPSGHTATVFGFALLIALLIQSTALTIVCVFAALVIAYTRIYLSQHYPLDVGAGMLVAVVSITIAVFIQRYFDKRRLNKRKVLS